MVSFGTLRLIAFIVCCLLHWFWVGCVVCCCVCCDCIIFVAGALFGYVLLVSYCLRVGLIFDCLYSVWVFCYFVLIAVCFLFYLCLCFCCVTFVVYLTDLFVVAVDLFCCVWWLFGVGFAVLDVLFWWLFACWFWICWWFDFYNSVVVVYMEVVCMFIVVLMLVSSVVVVFIDVVYFGWHVCCCLFVCVWCFEFWFGCLVLVCLLLVFTCLLVVYSGFYYLQLFSLCIVCLFVAARFVKCLF